jgi:hypothetical protein
MTKFDKPFVEVVWSDSANDVEGKWSTEEELVDEVEIISRGWLIKSTKSGGVVLAASRYLSGSKWVYGESVSIPLGSIISKREV